MPDINHILAGLSQGRPIGHPILDMLRPAIMKHMVARPMPGSLQSPYDAQLAASCNQDMMQIGVNSLLHNPLMDKLSAARPVIPGSMAPTLESNLKPHQIRVVKRMSESDGLVAAHGTGTGKTLSSIATYKSLGAPKSTIIVPAALRENYRKEFKKWMGKVPSNVSIESHQSVARRGIKNDSPGGLLIVDEAHRARDYGSKLYSALQKSQAKKRLLLTATPVYNDPSDISSLVNLAARKRLLPEDKAEFHKSYVGEREVQPPFFQKLMGVKPGLVPTLRGKDQLGATLNKYVDYHKGQTEGFPESSEETIKVPMGPHQTDVYKSIMGSAPWWVRQKVKWGLPPGKGELNAMKAFLTGARQVSNTDAPFIRNPAKAESTKVDAAVSNLKAMMKKDPRFKAVVYSNYLDSGLGPYKQKLDKGHIPYGEFSGDINDRVRNQLVKQYNANKLKALLISSAGAEGLDLKGTKLLQILEPHFNEEKEKQITGRAIRYKSHDALPESERKVLIQRYLAQPQAGFVQRMFGTKGVKGTDEYIRGLAQHKADLNQELLGLLDPAKKRNLLSRIINPQ